ncbi:7-cyano-7-deazaguanine synthase QueC [Acinetobacter puyangensis]|uniref:7-cyano-7-deazaguanine synthase n=1 Tax=Acinetobacter puyangensis TaxID=1096779 RepID=A0A240E7D4_9GAMM|nr:7-cyano-7-deazaguanine synthase QueC [Acinetobacter puyangensis]SNX43805.1 preQ(0) biosynthesis protein QueC [Acinetobacter puyangensis]
MRPKAVVLLSGGLDSSTCLAWAAAQYDCYAISFMYGQRSTSELKAAQTLAQQFALEHRIINIDLGNIGGSALTDHNLDVPEQLEDGIPITYVPARNTIFLSYALALAEVKEAEAIVIGVNAVDYSGYPDCRPEYIDAFTKMANLATKAGIEGHPIKIETPLLHLSKANIIQLGLKHGLDYSQTVSCYQADDQGRACGKCDSCRLRHQGFVEANVTDPTRYIM